MVHPICWRKLIHKLCLLACITFSVFAHASEYRGRVTYNGLSVPGAVVTATQGSTKYVSVSDEQGDYIFANLPDGFWNIKVEMSGFSTLNQEVTVAPNEPTIKWELKMLPLDQLMEQSRLMKTSPIREGTENIQNGVVKNDVGQATAPKPAEESSQQPADGFLVNGSVNNAATSQFSLAQAFGNSRSAAKRLYTGGIALVLDSSALDARPYSLSGLDTPKPTYNSVTGGLTFGGPVNIPHHMPHGPNLFTAYQWTRNQVASTDSGLVPTAEQHAVTSFDPVKALLALYPLPNVVGNPQYNYQVSVLGSSHKDVLQTRLDKSLGDRDEVYGGFAFQSIRANNSNLFSFVDTTDTLGINTHINWEHRFNHRIYLDVGYQFSRIRIQVRPYFAGREDICGNAGISGTDQTPSNWGPPTLVFANGIASLSDASSFFNRNRTDGLSPSIQYYRGHHNFTFGGDFRRQEFNYFSQANPRGTFTFLGANDFTDFLQGIPDTTSISFGNADKYLRQSVYDAYATDDWRIRPNLTLNVGVRWEYGAPITELKQRLVNLDVVPDFSAAAPVLASSPTGALTGQRYPSSLMRPDRDGIEPRIGISWRPIAGSSVVVRAGYGVYQDTSVYQATALQLAQQSPFAKSLNLTNSVVCPLTLISGFTPALTCPSSSPDTFAIDPNFRVGYAQTWQLAVQRDLPYALQITATYLGIKGVHGVQEFLPNTYPLGGTNPCPGCPSNFVYRTSNGNSMREAGSLQLRRRLRSGFTASLRYTYSKSIDDDSVLGGQGPVAAGAASQSTASVSIAQNWLDLNAERGLSTFDQRHLLNASIQYTTGMGLGGGAVLSGWRGRMFKEWTILGTIAAGSGLPETPVYLVAVNGTALTGFTRPDLTSASLYAASGNVHLNTEAYRAPSIGQWGDASRDSIIGPRQFMFNASLSRSFRIDKRYDLDVRFDSTNLFNHVVFTSWNTTINSAQFGLPVDTNPMRSLQITARWRF